MLCRALRRAGRIRSRLVLPIPFVVVLSLLIAWSD